MSQTQYIYNDSDNNLLSSLSELFENAVTVDCAIAFLTLRGWHSLKPIITQWIEKPDSKKLRIIVRKDDSFPDMRAVDEILQLKKVQIRLFPSEAFHLKQWLFYYPDKVKVLTGSSNFTEQGLKHNIEANILTEMASDDPNLKTIQNQFNKCWQHGQNLGENIMEIASGLTMKLQKVTYDEIKWIDDLYQDNQNVFDYRIQGIAVMGEGHINDAIAQHLTITFSGLSDQTIKVMSEMKERFQSQEDES